MIDGPQKVFDALLRPQAADRAEEPGVSRKAKLAQQVLPGDGVVARGLFDAVVNDDELFGGQPATDIKVLHTVAVGDDFFCAFRKPTIDGELVGPLPGIDTALACDDVRHFGQSGSLAAIGIGREEPGVNDVGAELADVPLKTPKAEGVDLPALADDSDRDAGGAELSFQRTGMREDGDMDVELVARQAGGEQRELLLSAATDERRDDEEDANHGGGSE